MHQTLVISFIFVTSESSNIIFFSFYFDQYLSELSSEDKAVNAP